MKDLILIFSNHAKKRIKEREIDENLIRKCITNPDNIMSSNTQNEIISSLKINGKILLVVFKKTDNINFVITAFMSSKVKRYSH